MRQVTYGYRKQLAGVSFEDARRRTVDALKSEGFGVLTEIDVRATMKAKLGIEFPPYVILGACNPQLAHRTLEAEPELGLLLPCNVVVTATADGSEVQVANPRELFKIVDNGELAPLADEVATKLQRVLERV
jgi:uncharacterized protein (DUF302 family)